MLAALLLLTVGRGVARADWQVHRGDSGALLERAEQALRERPDDDEVARRLVRIAGPRGQAALAERFRARAAGATGYAPLAAYARLLLAQGDPAAAAAFAGGASRIAQSVPALAGRARALAAAGATDEALAGYDEALRLEQRPAARRRLVEAELAIVAARSTDSPATEDLERTVTLRRELATVDPDRDGSAARLADALEQAGRPAEAAAVLEARLAAGTRGGEARRSLSGRRACVSPTDRRPTRRGAARRARRAAGTAAGRGTPSADARSGPARSRRRAAWGRWRSSRGRSSSLGDRAGAAEWDALGQARDEMGDLEGALAATRAAAAHAPRDPETARRLVALLDRLGRDDEATGACEELARRIPSNPRFAVELVDRQMRHGHRDEAGAALDRAITRFARDRGALLELATVAARWGDEGRALGAWQRLAPARPGERGRDRRSR